MRELCGAEFDAVEASFAHRAPADIRPYRTRFHGRLFFDAEHYAIGFMRSWLDGRPAGADAELQQLLKSQVDALDAKQGLRFPDQVRSVLRTSLLTGHASEAQIAAIFSMPKHTLSRRLESDGTGFRELVDECRFEIARQMLADTSLEVGEIGVALGYSRSSAFIRAFRRWSGTTPSIWRSNRDRGPF
jgi:AraC-like DNA-binding protein